MSLPNAARLAFALALAGCHAPAPTPPGGEPCEGAYRHLGDFGCEPKKPYSGTWIDVCRTGRENGLFDLRCISAADNVPAVEKCGVTCTGH
jgi:hypothetical protein